MGRGVRSGDVGEGLTHQQVFKLLAPYDLVARSGDALTTVAKMLYAFMNYIEVHRGERVSATLPAPPAKVVSSLLSRFDVAFNIPPPRELRLPYSLRCRTRGGHWLSPTELSSGEQAILALVATIVAEDVKPYSDPERTFLLLLDEPDAHIHTELIRKYLDGLGRLTKLNMQIIMTTHRPETMLLCPPESLFELRRNGDAVDFEPMPPPRRPALIARLAGDTVAVMSGTRVVWVEDEDDRTFHQGAYELALCFDNLRLPSLPPLAFMPAMSKPDKEGKAVGGATGDGGWTAVVKRMNELRNQGMQAVFRGLVDGDDRKATLPADVLRLDRYSIESYWADPLGLYQWAVHSDTPRGKEIAAAGGVPLTELNDLRSFEAARLQRAADAIIERVEASLPADQPRNRREVTLMSAKGSVVLRYPEWMWTTPKRLLTDAVTTALTGGVHHGWKKALRAVGFVPADLIDIYRRLITERL